MSHTVFSRLAWGSGLKACGWLNNENGLRGNEELRHSIRTVVSLFSPLVRSGTTEILLMWPLPDRKGVRFSLDRFVLCSVIISLDTVSKGLKPNGSGGLIWDFALIEEHLLVFLINKLPASSLWLTLKCYPTSSISGDISISVFVKMMLISSITAALIFQRRTAFCTHTCLPDMPISPWQFHILPSDR